MYLSLQILLYTGRYLLMIKIGASFPVTVQGCDVV